MSTYIREKLLQVAQWGVIVGMISMWICLAISIWERLGIYIISAEILVLVLLHRGDKVTAWVKGPTMNMSRPGPQIVFCCVILVFLAAAGYILSHAIAR